MNDPTAVMVQTLIECSLDEMSIWAENHPDILSLAFLEQCKQESDSDLRSDPNRSDALTERMVWLAQHAINNEPLATPLAVWARGNWACFHFPSQALQWYQRALEGYTTPETPVEMARILSNMVAVGVMCARFQEALDAYQMAGSILENLTGTDREYLLSLKQNYGLLLHYLGRYEEAMDAYDDAKNLAQELNHMDHWGEIQVNQAYTMAMLGQLNHCEEMLLESRQISADSGSHLTTARIDLNLGLLYTALGRLADALFIFQRARQTFSMLQNSIEDRSILLYEADLLEKIGAWHEARQCYNQARVHFSELDMQFEVGISLTREGAINRHYGEYVQAEKLLQEALAIWQTLGHPTWQTRTQLEQVELFLATQQSEKAFSLLAQCESHDLPPALAAQYHALLADTQAQRWLQNGDPSLYQEAYRTYENLLNYSEQNGVLSMECRAWTGLGQLMQDSSREQAYSMLEKAVICEEQIRHRLSIPELRASFQHQRSKLLPLLAKMAIEDGQFDRALQYIWRAKGDSLLELLQFSQKTESFLKNSTFDEIHSPPDQVAAEIEQTRQDLASHRWQMLRETTSDMPESTVTHNHQEIRRLEERLHELRIERKHSASVTSEHAIHQPDPNQILQDMDVDVLIEYICSEKDVFAVRVDSPCSAQGSIRYQAIKLIDMGTLLDLGDALELAMRPILGMTSDKRVQQLSYQLAECQPLLQSIYDYLIVPLGELPINAKLLIAPDSFLHSLPFAALWDGQRYLTERYSLKITPTAALAMLPGTPPSHHPPLIIGASMEGSLTYIPKEIHTLHKLLPESTVLLDDPKSLYHLSNLPAPPHILHLSSATIHHKNMSLFTTLQLAENVLSIEQCYELPLQGTQLVTLSTGITPSGMDSSSSLISFQSAFFVAGAQQVVSALRPINDEATYHWMTHFYTHLAAGVEPSTALQFTQRTLINDPAYAHPAIWASFICSRRW